MAWIDVEGAQQDIIDGADTFLSRAGALYIEVDSVEVWSGQQKAAKVAEVLGARGFRPVMQDNLAEAQFNEIFVRDEEHILCHAEDVLEEYIANLENALSQNR